MSPTLSNTPAAPNTCRKLLAPLPIVSPANAAELAARIEAARAKAEPDLMFDVLLRADAHAVEALWSMPDMPTNTAAGSFWTGIKGPHILRMETDRPLPSHPLLFVTRQGGETADYAALAGALEEAGPNLDAPIVTLAEWLPEKERRYQIVLMLKARAVICSQADTEAHNG